MALSVKGEQVESILRKLLKRKNFVLNKRLSHGEHGADIIAKKNRENIFIECIGFQEVPHLRSKQFYEVFFRAISRLKNGAKRCIIALPMRFKTGMNRRAKQYGEAWKRIGKAFPELEIWFINAEEGDCEEHKWNEWPC